MKERLLTMFEPTPVKGAISAVASVGFDQTNKVMDNTTTVFLVSIGDWAAYASIGTLVFALTSLFIAIPRIIETAVFLLRLFRTSVMGHEPSAIEAKMDRIEQQVGAAAEKAKDKIDAGVEKVVEEVRKAGDETQHK